MYLSGALRNDLSIIKTILDDAALSGTSFEWISGRPGLFLLRGHNSEFLQRRRGAGLMLWCVNIWQLRKSGRDGADSEPSRDHLTKHALPLIMLPEVRKAAIVFRNEAHTRSEPNFP